MTNETEAPKIEFPHPNYPIKVIGDNQADFKGMVIEIVQVHAPDLDVELVEVSTVVPKDGSEPKWSAVRLKITATSKRQLEQMHLDLKATGRVKMVL